MSYSSTGWIDTGSYTDAVEYNTDRLNRLNAITSGAKDALSSAKSSLSTANSSLSSANSNYAKASGLASQATSSANLAKSSAAQLTNVGASAMGLVSGVDSSYAAARQSAADADQDIAGIRKQAALVNSQADSIKPLANTVSGYGDTIWDQASQVASSGIANIDIGNALLNLDGSGGGVASEWVKLYNALSGDNQVSMAASDVQSSYQNAGEQALRAKARTGAQGGTTDALRKQYAQSLATAYAAAKTRARKSAITDQASMLGNITTAANQIIEQGTSTYSAGLTGQNAAVSAKTQAGELEKSVADIYATGGSLYGTAATAQLNQASVYSDIQKNVDAAKNAYMSTASDAYKSAGSLQISAASSYASVIDALNGAMSQINSATSNVNSATSNVVSAGNNLTDAAETAYKYFNGNYR